MAESIVMGKALDFAVRIAKLYRYLCNEKREFIISKQLLRSGTSIGANLREAKYAQSTNDFISKNSIALKEVSETEYWLELLYKTDYLTEHQYKDINSDYTEIAKMLTSTVKSLKGNNC